MEFFSNSKMSLMNKIMTLFVGYMIIVMFIFSLVIYFVDRSSVQKINAGYSQDIALLEANMVDQWFDDSQDILYGISALGNAENISDGTYIDGIKDIQQHNKERFRNFFVIDFSKDINNYMDTLNVVATNTNDPMVERIKNGEKSVLISPEMNIALNEALMILMVPIVEDGNVIGTLGALITMEDLSIRLDEFEVNGAGFGWLVDENLTVVAHPNKDYVLKMSLLEKEEISELSYVNTTIRSSSDFDFNGLETTIDSTKNVISYTDPDGYERTLSFSELNSMDGWKVVFTSFDDKEPSSANRLLIYMAIGLFITVIISVLTSYFFANDITKPINKLIHVVTLFSEGNNGVRFTSKTNDEIGTLAKAFNGMADTIIKHTDNVEELIKERTHMLSDLNYQIVVRNQELDTMNKELETTNDKLHTLATTDMLTGLQNRHDLVRTMQGFIDDVVRGDDAGFSVLFVDLDNFKYYNDTFSHEIGDYLLVEVSKILKENVRENDLVSRYGGDEFVILLKHGNFDISKMLSERIHAKILEKSGFRKEIERKIGSEIKLLGKNKLSCSIGIVNYNRSINITTSDELLALADDTMYKAKKAGKSRIVVN